MTNGLNYKESQQFGNYLKPDININLPVKILGSAYCKQAVTKPKNIYKNLDGCIKSFIVQLPTGSSNSCFFSVYKTLRKPPRIQVSTFYLRRAAKTSVRVKPGFDPFFLLVRLALMKNKEPQPVLHRRKKY